MEFEDCPYCRRMRRRIALGLAVVATGAAAAYWLFG